MELEESTYLTSGSTTKPVGRYCRLYLQPEWSVFDKIMPEIVEYAKQHPKWSISVQTHKFMKIP